MNKTIFKILPLAAVLLATSCSKDDGNVATDVVNKESETTIPAKPATFTVTVSYAPKSLSKTTIDVDGMTYTETIKEIFEVGDVLRLMNGSQVVAESNALTDADIKTDKSKAEFTFANVVATDYTANTALTVVLTKASTGINPCASEMKVGTTLSAAVQNYGYWTDDNAVTLDLFESQKNEKEEVVPVSYKVPDGTTFTLSQQNAFVVIPTNGVCKIGVTQYEEAGVYAIPASTNVQPLFKREVDAVEGNVYYVPAVESRVIYSVFNDFPELDEDGYQWDKAEGDVFLEENKLKVAYNTDNGVGYVRAFNSTSGKYNIYKLTVETFPDNIPETTIELGKEEWDFIPWIEGSFYQGGDCGVELTVDSDTQTVKVMAVDYGDTYIKCIDASGNVTYYKVYVPYYD